MNKVLHAVLLLILWGFSATASSAAQCRLTVKATPHDSRIRIMNINPKYSPSIPLKCGKRYDILVNKQGYITYRQWITVDQQHHTIEVVLEKPSRSTFEAIKAGMLEHKEKTLAALNRIFKDRQVGYLDKISTSRFQSSEWYNTLQKYVSSSYRINLNHISEAATQEFIINGNERDVLVVDFEKSKETNLWYITDAYIKRNGKTQQLRKDGFRPLEFERHFSELVKKIKSGKIWYGLAPHGKLSSRFLKGKKLSLSRNRSVKVKNVIIHDGKQVIEVIFLTLEYYPAGYKEGTYKSGWLLASGGSMLTLYKPGENIYADIWAKRDLKLNAPNEGLVFFNLGELKRNGGEARPDKQEPSAVAVDSSATASKITGISCDRPAVCDGCFRIVFEGSSSLESILMMNQSDIKQERKLRLSAPHDIQIEEQCKSDLKWARDFYLEIDLSKLGVIQDFRIKENYIDLYY